MFRIVLNAVILPLEFASLQVTSADHGAASWWIVAATLASAAPTAIHWAGGLFGEQEPEARTVV